MAQKKQEPAITSITDLSPSEARWATLQKIDFVDETGTPRSWEMAARKTRSKSGIDAVAIGNIILHPSRPASTVIVIQYRPPLDAYTIEWPAGLVDADESVEEAAIRELKEETGYGGTGAKILSVSPTVAADPGLSSANMKLVMVEMSLGKDEEPAEQRLDDEEHIQRVVVPLSELYQRLSDYSKKERRVVAAKLWHFAQGMEFMRTQKYF